MRRRLLRKSALVTNEEAMINLTPLIDVVFVMLIMFIIVAPLLELDQVELAPGSAHTQELQASMKESSPLSIHVRANNTIWINKQQVSLEMLPKLLKVAHERSPNATPLLFHDKKAFFGTYQEVKNRLEEAGFKDLNIVLTPS